MTKTLTRSAPPSQLLARILEEPELVTVVQNLEARVLSAVINHIGLEDSGELVSLATTDQLKKIFDDDLWRSEKPGQDEIFDATRFALWLQILLEAGEDFAAHKLAELDEDLVTLALCKQLLVINIDELAVRMSETHRSFDDDLMDKALESCLYQEFEEYRLIAKDHDGWDAILAVLVTLDQENHELLRRFLDRCSYISSEYIEDNGGLYDVLTSDEMLETDVAFEREQRREQEGFVSPSAAASFLTLARVTPLEEILKSSTIDPVTRAHFRVFAPRGRAATRQRKPEAPSIAAPPPAEPSRKVAAFLETLREAEVLPPPAAALLSAGASESDRSTSELPLLQQGMRTLAAQDSTQYEERMRELAYLANVLISGCSFDGRSFRPFEAAEAVIAVCNLGLEQVLEEESIDSSAAAIVERVAIVLSRREAVKLFRAGWNILYHEVSLFAGQRLAHALVSKNQTMAEAFTSTRWMTDLLAVLQAGLAQGKPWVVRAKLVVLEEFLDAAMVSTLRAVLDECPSVPAPLAEESKSQTRCALFFSHKKQVRRVQDFLREALATIDPHP